MFVTALGLGMYIYFIPVFAQSFGATFFDLGLIGTVWAIATTITPIFAGHLADKTNRAWIYVVSLMVNGFATIILITSHSVLDIIILRFLGGIGMEAFWVTTEIMVTDLAPKEERVREMGRYGIALTMGLLFGPLIGGLVVERFGYINLFIISSAVIGISTVQALIWLVPGYRRLETTIPQSTSTNTRAIKLLLPLCIMIVCYGVVWGLITSIFPGYANSVGISAALIGSLFAAFGVARMVSYATAHRYLKFGKSRTLFFASLTIFVGMVTMAIQPSFISLLVGITLIGGSLGLTFPITIDLISRYFPDDRAGKAIASYETAINIGECVGPYLAGILTVITTIAGSMLLMSVFGILMAIIAVTGRTET